MEIHGAFVLEVHPASLDHQDAFGWVLEEMALAVDQVDSNVVAGSAIAEISDEKVDEVSKHADECVLEAS